jgi:retron-type reverse transcriptase
VDNEKIYSSKKELLKFLGIKENYLYSDFSDKYKEKEIQKKKGGTRKIMPPNFNLKKIQRKILDEILCKIPQLECVYGLSKNKGIVDNAKLHKNNFSKQLLNLDIENFFPSISNKEVYKIFNKIGFNKENSLILTKLCTIDKALPQGAPTSPYLASMVCSRLDKKIFNYCKNRDFVYTRYFDDISISGKNILPKHEDYFIEIIQSHGFNSNQKKREFFDYDKDKVINNVLITRLGLSVSDSYKKDIEDIYKRMIDDNNTTNQRVFAGKFGFYLHVNRRGAKSFLRQLKFIKNAI